VSILIGLFTGVAISSGILVVVSFFAFVDAIEQSKAVRAKAFWQWFTMLSLSIISCAMNAGAVHWVNGH